MPARKRSRSGDRGRGKVSKHRVRFRGGKKVSGKSKSGKGKSASSLKLPMEGPKSMDDMKFNSYIKKVSFNLFKGKITDERFMS